MLGLGVSMYFYASPELGGTDPSSLREVTGFKEYLDKDGNREVLYAYKSIKVTNNLIDDHTELVSSERKKDKKGKDIIENTYKIWPEGQFLKQGNEWFEVLHATTTQNKFSRPVASYFINMALATDFVSTTDAFQRRAPAGDTWAQIRGGVGTSNELSSLATTLIESTPGVYTRMQRSKSVYDASSIDDSFVVTSASLTMMTRGNNAGDQYGFCWYITSHDTDTPAANGEYEDALVNGNTKYSDTVLCDADFVASGQDTWTFNAAGIAGISLTTTTGIGIRFDDDFDNVEPTGTGEQEVSWWSANDGTGAQDPFLTVVASAPAVASDSGEGIIFQQW